MQKQTKALEDALARQKEEEADEQYKATKSVVCLPHLFPLYL